jgi:16S rRNA (cytosine1402-N4)-methyltransferase
MDLPPSGHEPVLLAEVLDCLAPVAGRTIIDCTIGRGGHALAIAQRLGPAGVLIGMDVDPANLEFAKARLLTAPCQVRLFHANFTQIEEVLAEVGADSVHGILADLGVSTNQLFESQYGLSFAQEMPLDMRLDPRIRRSAADFVNHVREQELADILFNLAQERYSRRIARKIVEARRVSPITTTERLAAIVRSAIPARGGAPERIDPATRTFLALRMHVNQEMENLKHLLERGLRRLKSGGKMVVISFQSMEDRLAKQAFRSAEQAGRVRILTSKPVVPSPVEMDQNPRSRSSKLRAVEAL